MRCILCRLALAAVMLLALVGCEEDDFDLDDQSDASMTHITLDQTYFKDAHGRYLFMHGVNVSGSTKVPTTADPISYVGKPFPLDQADRHFKLLRDMGFNSIRLLVNWEGLEPYARGEYDEEYLDYLEAIVAKAEDYGIYVLMDMHQDMFSRHMYTLYNDGSDEQWLIDPREIAKAEPYGFNNRVGGDGAPEWVVQRCLPDRDVGGSQWGLPRPLVTDRNATNDVLPWTSWFLNMALSVDMNRCWATFFAGSDVYPQYYYEGEQIQDYLQNALADAWVEVAKRVGKYDNVLGYDIMNEPGGLFIVYTIYALLFDAFNAKALPADADINDLALHYLDRELDRLADRGASRDNLDLMRWTILNWDLLPKSADDLAWAGFDVPGADPKIAEKLAAKGPLFRPDSGAVIGLNSNFNRNYLAPFYGRVGERILEVDPDTSIWIEEVVGLPDRGLAGQWAEPMLRPEGIPAGRLVNAPHAYADIYPFIGFDQPPREFTVEEKRFRDYAPIIEGKIETSKFSLGNPPTVVGEFGSYFNFNGIEESVDSDYIVSSVILENYYEALDDMLQHRMLWCYSGENSYEDGEGWNKEDFSIADPDLKPRSWVAYSRTMPRFTSGRLTSFHFNSPIKYYEPRPDVTTPVLEFEMEMLGKETDAPTEIFVPPLHYTDGFYVYLSDGRADFDDTRHILYWWPSDDNPDATHHIRIRPPYEDDGDAAWNYFFHDDQVLEGVRP
ncbi:MAG: cellulase family glycosylhydrolase [Deltaproteobacteria bacterium]|nr:cellulase family glycosylhydrolase [Deltaproteobacteria bacterium]MCB9490249.1 cellulase family glycosylhydrolase [Deltaproteobacteria bacterium]